MVFFKKLVSFLFLILLVLFVIGVLVSMVIQMFGVFGWYSDSIVIVCFVVVDKVIFQGVLVLCNNCGDVQSVIFGEDDFRVKFVEVEKVEQVGYDVILVVIGIVDFVCCEEFVDILKQCWNVVVL